MQLTMVPDILEGVNDAQTNQATLHTGSTCSISSSNMSENISADNCDVSDGDNTGCGITTTDQAIYGATFNTNGGGVYATLITTSNIIVWFWPRGSVPNDVLSGVPDALSWSTPIANISGPCNFGSTFTAQQLVFDTTFCGDWAGLVWPQSACVTKPMLPIMAPISQIPTGQSTGSEYIKRIQSHNLAQLLLP